MLYRLYSERKRLLLLLVVLLGIGITIFLILRPTRFFTKAQESDRVETENGVISGNVTVIDDQTASGGKFARLKSSETIAGTTYYIDCLSGSDTDSGTSETTAWKTLSKASQASLSPGDGLLLKRGTTCTGSLALPWNGSDTTPIRIDAYGTGDLPTIESNVNNARLVNVTGSYITIENLFAKGIAPSTEAACDNNPKGYIIGFQLDDTSHHITLRNSQASGSYAGVYIKSGSNNNKILNNTINNNNMMNPLDVGGDGDAGAFGVLIHGADNEIAYNTLSGHDACSYDYDRDGSDVEIYGGSRNVIHHNKASQSDHFSELGKNSSQSSSDNTYAYNSFTSTLTDSVFLNTRGEGHTYGPIYNTKVFNNSTYLTGSQSQGIVCSNCGSTILTLRNNILWANWKSIYSSTSFTEFNNIYWKIGGNPLIQGFTISSTSQIADPRYVNPQTGDLHIQSDSPAVDAGSNESVSAGFSVDLDGKAVPSGLLPDVGAYEL
ncbi:MAG: choice-of-anchor Q domain-containing protein [bacterium]|nr:choice-of-anchor Q domain-containing protein [bacterium]